MSATSISRKDFFRVHKEFELGSLSTEGINIKTRNLSDAAKLDPRSAVKMLQEIDFDALNLLEKRLEGIYELHREIQDTLESGGRIFLCGCGATGRLSLALETIWRMAGEKRGKERMDQVVGFMAGGDYALIKSVERFEDKMSYGHRQLEDLGFGKNDLLLAITEGGETSFVIGSALWAKEASTRKPWFLYCNPDHELRAIKRSNDVLQDSEIIKLNLSVGPMAVSGSTRMQATTVQMTAAALAFFLEAPSRREFIANAKSELTGLRNLSLDGLVALIEKESEIYKNGGRVTYVCSPESAITILTDTTERSPTFSLEPFEKLGESHRSLAFLAVKGCRTSKEAWTSLLQRAPRGLSWSDLDIKIDEDEIYKFDISESAVQNRSAGLHETFELRDQENSFVFSLGSVRAEMLKSSKLEIMNQIALKMALNILSTTIMGRIGRFEGNVMTYVRPSNFKLIDRASRYVIELGSQEGLQFDYMDVANEIFDQIPALGPDEPVVLKALEALKKKQA